MTATVVGAARCPDRAACQTSVQANMVTNWFGQSSQGGFFAAAMNGHYAEQGLDMTVDQGGPQVAGVPLVAAGKYTFAMTSSEQVLLARAEGVPLVMVFGTFQRNPQGLMFHNSNPVADFAGLNGRKVYVSGAGTFWQVLKAKYNLDEGRADAVQRPERPVPGRRDVGLAVLRHLGADHPEDPGLRHRLPGERRLRLQPVPERDGLHRADDQGSPGSGPGVRQRGADGLDGLHRPIRCRRSSTSRTTTPRS